MSVLMTANPKQISPETLASEAARLMNRGNITNLLVTDQDQRPIGLVRLHDLMRAGVV
jgi:arabinose-5-phosphate isomerase